MSYSQVCISGLFYKGKGGGLCEGYYTRKYVKRLRPRGVYTRVFHTWECNNHHLVHRPVYTQVALQFSKIGAGAYSAQL